RPGVAVNYDNDSKSIEFYTNPAKVGDGRSDKVMVPTDGGTPQKGKGDVVYDHDARPSNHEAGSKDLTNVTDTTKNADQERQQIAGLTMDMKVSAPAETIGLKFDSPEVKNEAVPLFREVKQTAAPEKTDSTVFKPDKPPVSTSPLEKHVNS